MRIGIGLPAAVPGVDATTIGAWAAEAERAGFADAGVTDVVLYPSSGELHQVQLLAEAVRSGVRL